MAPSRAPRSARDLPRLPAEPALYHSDCTSVEAGCRRSDTVVSVGPTLPSLSTSAGCRGRRLGWRLRAGNACARARKLPSARLNTMRLFHRPGDDRRSRSHFREIGEVALTAFSDTSLRCSINFNHTFTDVPGCFPRGAGANFLVLPGDSTQAGKNWTRHCQ